MKKVLYFVADDRYFCSHRLPLALAVQAAGAEVVVVTHVTHHKDVIENAGFKLISLQSFHRSKLILWNELCVLIKLFSIFSQEKPCIVHTIGMKLVLYGSFISLITNIPKTVNMLTGLGFLFTHNTRKTIFPRKILSFLFKNVLFNTKKSALILQNADDYAYFQEHKLIAPERLFLIRGSGVDPQTFQYTPEPEETGEIRVAFVSRMLRDKGVMELIEAIRLLKARRIAAKFLFCGDVDPQNPSSVRSTDLEAWHKEGLIEWQGQRDDIHKVYENVHVAVLPSYREGLPKSLLEAAACGRPIVSTDVPGCREIVEHGVNGLLVPPRDPSQLAHALEKLIGNKALRESMGREGRKMVETHFSLEKILPETLECYGLKRVRAST